MPRSIQWLLLVAGFLALGVLLFEIGASIAATTHSSTPARVVKTQAGPYTLLVTLYKDPADASFALPFAIAPTQTIEENLSYEVTSYPGTHVQATPIRASLTADTKIKNGVQGAAEIPVQGTWRLHIIVHSTTESGATDIFIKAVAPPAIPLWLGWPLGLIPLIALLVFLGLQRGKKPQKTF